MTVTAEHAPQVTVCRDREDLGRTAGGLAAEVIRSAIVHAGQARVILAAAPSQSATLAALATEPDLDWSRVECFHMDEYVGLPPTAPQSFRNWLHRSFLDKVPQATFHPLVPEDGPDAYAALMGDAPFDLVLFGLGVNGHLAFNDPPADFEDPQPARVVALDETSRHQQVDEGNFAELTDVPTHALTVTIPRLLNARELVGSVPGAAKRQAVHDSLNRPLSPAYPGTALRTHPRVRLFLDAESAP